MTEGCCGETIAENGDLRVIDCWRCGYAHLLPIPTDKELAELYHDEYYQKHNLGWFEKERREQWYWRAVYRQRIRTFEQLAPDKDAHLVFDSGAGCGWFVKAVKGEPGLVVWGHEPSLHARIEARAVVFRDEVSLIFAEVHTAPGIISLVHSCMVMEHLVDPLIHLRAMHRILCDGGIMCLIVPNEFNPLQMELTRRYGYSPVHPHHINYFNWASLRHLTMKAGFQPKRVLGTFPMEWFALRGLNYVKHPRLGPIAHKARMLIERTALAVAPDKWERLRKRWADEGIGREIELWLRKA